MADTQSSAPAKAYVVPPSALKHPVAGENMTGMQGANASTIGYGNQSGLTPAPGALNQGIGIDTNKPGDADGVGQIDYTPILALPPGQPIEPAPDADTQRLYSYFIKAGIVTGTGYVDVPGGGILDVVLVGAFNAQGSPVNSGAVQLQWSRFSDGAVVVLYLQSAGVVAIPALSDPDTIGLRIFAGAPANIDRVDLHIYLT